MTLICLCSLLFLYNTRKPEHEPGTNEEAFSATRRDQRPAVSSSAAADPDDPVNCDIHNPVLNNTGISNSRCDDAKYTEVAVLPGTYGRIFVVTDPGQQLYALKMHSCEKQNNGIAEVGSLEVEIKILSSLRHPNIIKLIDADYNMNKFLVSRLYENGDLRSFYDHYRLPCHLQLRVILGIASALSYLHNMHYAHRSLRPGHVLLDGQFVPRLSGFGYATYCLCADGQTPLLQEERHNSLAYSPVEALGIHNPQIADIYSLGAIFYFILFGCDVFAGVPFEARVVPFENSDNMSPCGWEEADPGWCLSLVERMLSRQPDPRPTAEDVIQIVERNAQ